MAASTRIVLVIVVVIVVLACRALGDDVVWDDELGNHAWSSGQNWVSDIKPGANDDAIVGAPAPAVVALLEQIANLFVLGSGEVRITTGMLELLQGSATNDGVIRISDGSASAAALQFSAAGALDGGGEVVLGKYTGGNNDATLHAGNGVVTHGATHTVRGEGRISGTWTNDGLIRAEETTGDSTATLRLNSTTMTNNGTMRSSPTGVLDLNGATITQGAGGQIVADTQVVRVSAGEIIGGTLESASDGAFFVLNGVLALSGVTNNGSMSVVSSSASAQIVADSTGFTNNGTILLDRVTGLGSAELLIDLQTAIDGTGDLILNRDNSGTQISEGYLTNGPEHTIRGVGWLRANIINNGAIIAEVRNGSTLRIFRPVTNNNLLHANSGATLRIGGIYDVVQSAAGVISAGPGGTVELDLSGSIINGTLAAIGNGQLFVPTGGQPILVDVTTVSPIDVEWAGTLRLGGSSFTNFSTVTINVNNNGTSTSLRVQGNVLLTGDGEIILNNGSTLWVEGSWVLTNAQEHTIRGRGSVIGNVVNNGRIEGFGMFADVLNFHGMVSGTGLLKNVEFSSSATHAPGENGAAIVPIEGVYRLEDDDVVLHIELGGETPGTEHDQLSSTGNVILNGTLKVTVLPDYFPSGGEQFTIITTSGGTITGTFDAIDALGEYEIQYNTTSVVLTMLSPAPFCHADVATSATSQPPPDGQVDGADLAFLLGEWGRNPGSPADIVTSATFAPPPDGFVNGADLAFLLGAWGACP